MSASTARADGQPQDVIASLLGTVEALRRENEQLQGALTSRVGIEQAKGILGERLGIGPEEAFILLRRAARSSRMKLHDLARDVVASRETPAEIRLVLERWEQRLDPAALH
jgi:AmiR/NasT family two-component response regulator